MMPGRTVPRGGRTSVGRSDTTSNQSLCLALLTIILAVSASQPAKAQRQVEATRPLPEPLIRLLPKADSAAGFVRCLDDRQTTIVSAHRGGPVPEYPENALETFAFTLGHMPALIEMDVRRTKDGALVLIHDEDVARTSTGTGRIGELTLEEIGRLELEDNTGRRPRGGYRVPTLEAALAWAKNRGIVVLDLKRGVDAMDVAATVRRSGAPGRTVMIVGPEEAARVARQEPAISYSLSLRSIDDLEEAVRMGVPQDRILAFTGVGPENPGLWAELDRRGVPVIHGTLWDGDRDIAATNENARYARLAERGVDVLVTDRHFEAYWALEGRQDTAEAVRACGGD